MQVYPVMGFPDPTVVNAAQRIVNEHQGKFSQTSRILQQVSTLFIAYYFYFDIKKFFSVDGHDNTCD